MIRLSLEVEKEFKFSLIFLYICDIFRALLCVKHLAVIVRFLSGILEQVATRNLCLKLVTKVEAVSRGALCGYL